MLLDTMCNAFGGLILIAILIAILARTSDVEPGPEDQAEYLRAFGENRKFDRPFGQKTSFWPIFAPERIFRE